MLFWFDLHQIRLKLSDSSLKLQAAGCGRGSTQVKLRLILVRLEPTIYCILLNTTPSNKRLKNMRVLRSTLYNDEELVYMAFKVLVVQYHGI